MCKNNAAYSTISTHPSSVEISEGLPQASMLDMHLLIFSEQAKKSQTL